MCEALFGIVFCLNILALSCFNFILADVFG